MQSHVIQKRAPVALQSFRLDFAVPLGVLGILVLITLRGVLILPDGFDGSQGLNISITLFLMIWLVLFGLRTTRPLSPKLAALEANVVFMSLSLVTPLASAAAAVGSGAFIDPWLIAADQALFPFYDWKAVALDLPNRPWLYAASSYIYSSLGWQPIVFIVLMMVIGKIADQIGFVTAWALGLLLCVLPFHWLPTQTPYIRYGISQDDMPGNLVALPWSFYPIFEGLRDGSITSISAGCMTGMISVPSFHGCGAIILAWAFWRVRWLRWPFLALNIAMALVTIPIGGHYIIEVIIGMGCGLIAIGIAAVLRKQREQLDRQNGSTAAPACLA